LIEAGEYLELEVGKKGEALNEDAEDPECEEALEDGALEASLRGEEPVVAREEVVEDVLGERGLRCGCGPASRP
jgi:hypothetical protein